MTQSEGAGSDGSSILYTAAHPGVSAAVHGSEVSSGNPFLEIAVRWQRCARRQRHLDSKEMSVEKTLAWNKAELTLLCFCRSSRSRLFVAIIEKKKKVWGREPPKGCLRKSLCVEPSINANPLTPQEGEWNSGSIWAHRNYLHQLRMRTSVENIQQNIIESSFSLWRSSRGGHFISWHWTQDFCAEFFWGQVSKTLIENYIRCTSSWPQIISSW